MDDELLTEYIAILHQYSDLLRRLYVHLEPSIRLQRLVHGTLDFMPTAPTIMQQIQQWPDALFRYPPVAWVHPRKGTLIVDDQSWSFAFHGAGLSFFQAATHCDVSGEFSSNGTLALTQHTVWCYLSTNPTDTANFAALGSLHEIYFKEAEARQVLIPVPPLLADDDQTYQIVELKATDERALRQACRLPIGCIVKRELRAFLDYFLPVWRREASHLRGNASWPHCACACAGG